METINRTVLLPIFECSVSARRQVHFLIKLQIHLVELSNKYIPANMNARSIQGMGFEISTETGSSPLVNYVTYA